MRIGGVLAGVTLDFTAGARKESPAGTITPLPRQSVTYSRGLLHSTGGKVPPGWWQLLGLSFGEASVNGDNDPDPGKVCKCKANEP